MIAKTFSSTCLAILLLIAFFPMITLAQLVLGDVQTIENFSLEDYDGNNHSLSDYKDSVAILIIFIATECPVSNDYNERMENLYKEYREKGIAFIGINSNKAEDVERIRNHAKKNRLTFTILKDLQNIVADLFEASFTPEAYVLNGDHEVMYHGRIDNSRNKSNISVQDLKNALDEILKGMTVTKPRTKAFGCTIKRV